MGVRYGGVKGVGVRYGGVKDVGVRYGGVRGGEIVGWEMAKVWGVRGGRRVDMKGFGG